MKATYFSIMYQHCCFNEYMYMLALETYYPINPFVRNPTRKASFLLGLSYHFII